MKTCFLLAVFVLILSTFSAYPQWIEQTLPGDIDVTLGIDFIDQNHGVMGGWHFNFAGQVIGNAFYTTNSGTIWFEASIPDSMRVMVGVQMFDNMNGYGAGAYNISGTQPSSNSNQNQNLPPRIRSYYEQLGMDFSGLQEARGYFVETTDGGLSWHPKGLFEDSVYYLTGMFFSDPQTGYVIASSPTASSNGLLKTTDGGYSWDYFFPFQEGIVIRDVRFFNQTGYLVYDDLILNRVMFLKTTDGGITWNIPLQLPFLSTSKVTYSDVNTIYISGLNVSYEGAVCSSIDGGNSWQEIHTYTSLHWVSGIGAVLNSDVLLVYGTYQPTGNAIPFVDISLDGGSSWNYFELSQFQDFSFFTSEMINEERWYLTGTQTFSQGFVLFTDNSGGVPVELVSFTAEAVDGKVNLNWTTATELNNLGFEVERKSESELWRTIGFVEGKGTTTETQNYNFVDDLFSVSDSKIFYRLKQIDFNGTYEYSEEIEVVSVPTSFSLRQNYPNPFNPSTKIKFTIPSVETTRRVVFTTLKIYDILGNEVATLVNEELPAGEYEVEFNPASSTENPASGIYFYKLQAGSFVETKKMILMK